MKKVINLFDASDLLLIVIAALVFVLSVSFANATPTQAPAQEKGASL